MLQRLAGFIISTKWETATRDPYVLVDIALYSWYERIDRVAWDITHLARRHEKVQFATMKQEKAQREMELEVTNDWKL